MESDLPEVELNSIEDIRDFLEMMKLKNSDELLSYSLNAQLQVISVINNPNMYSSAFDLILDNFYNALNQEKDENIKKDIQRKASLLINSMVFFMEAKLVYYKKEQKEQVDKLLKDACEMFVEVTVGIVGEVYGVESTSKIAKISANDLLKNILQKKDFFSNIWIYYQKKKKIKEEQQNFKEFIFLIIKKLSQYHNLLGRSILLQGVISRYKEIVIAKEIPIFEEPVQPKMPQSPLLPDYEAIYNPVLITVYITIGILVLLLIVWGGAALVSLIPGVEWESSVWNIIKYAFLFCLAGIIIVAFISSIDAIDKIIQFKKEQRIYRDKLKKYDELHEDYLDNLKQAKERHKNECNEIIRKYELLEELYRPE